MISKLNSDAAGIGPRGTSGRTRGCWLMVLAWLFTTGLFTTGARAVVPDGLSSTDWHDIRAAWQTSRHAFTVDDNGRWLARNPGQRWQTRFDGRGYTIRPDDGGWLWGLELRAVGFGGAGSDALPEQAHMVERDGQLHYDWTPMLREWFVNDERGLQQGWTLMARPVGADDGAPLQLELAVRGTLRPRILADGLGVTFHGDHGVSTLTYGGLLAWDADGTVLAARFESTGADAVRIAVDERGARYPITIDSVAQQAYLKASNTGPLEQFGFSVAISGNTVVVGAINDDSAATGVNGDQNDNSASSAGAAYVFVRNGSTWSQQAYLKASNTDQFDWFGWSVAISGDTVVVGATYESSPATGVNGGQGNSAAGHRSGAAYVFVRDGVTWSQQAYLKASNTRQLNNFGHAVAISGNTVLVSAPLEHSNATGVNGNQTNTNAVESGAVYVFVRNGSTWSQQAYIKASNTQRWDMFGWSVALSDDTAVIGSRGEDSNATGVDGDQADNSANNAGAAYVFVRNGGTWSQQAYLKASNTDPNDWFGWSVALSDDTAVIGSRGEDSNATGVDGDQADNSEENSGAAYVFVRNGITWSQQAYLKASNADAFDVFGQAVAISGDTVLVGAVIESSGATGVNGNQSDNSAVDAGAAYVFVRNGITWSQQAYLKASNTGAYDQFGYSVAISGDSTVVSANGESSAATGVDGDQADDSANRAGAAYIFSLVALDPVFRNGFE